MKKKLVAFVFGVVLCVSCSMLAFATQETTDNSGISAVSGGDVSEDDPTPTTPPEEPGEDEKSADEVIEDVLNGGYLAPDQADTVAESLVAAVKESSNFDLAKPETNVKVNSFEHQYAELKGITIKTPIFAENVENVFDGNILNVVGAVLALRSESNTTIQLVVKNTATIPEEGLTNAVAVDIDIVGADGTSLTGGKSFDFPVIISISVPTVLKDAGTIKIKHGSETINPTKNGSVLAFTVTHFSDFVFYDASNEGDESNNNGTGTGPTGGTGSNTSGGGSTGTGGSSIGSSGSCGSSASTPDYFGDYIKGVEQSITTAQKDSTVKIVTKDSITLTGDVMRSLIKNPTVSLYLEYTYNGKEYKVLIPAGEAFVVEGIELYGPLYLYSMFPYDEQEALTKGKEYTIVKGDTLSKIANKNKTTVSELVKLNKIKNPNRIRAGQKIVLPAR